MSIRAILKYPEKEQELRLKSEVVDSFDNEIRKLIKDMVNTTTANSGVGLAAPQIGAYKRVITVRLGQSPGGKSKLSTPLVIVNPEIASESRPVLEYDACLSIPNLYGQTYRPSSLQIKGLDENGEPLLKTFYGLDATVAHHEIDHLNGVLFIDRIKDLRKDLYVIINPHTKKTQVIPYSFYLQTIEKDELLVKHLLNMGQFNPQLYPDVELFTKEFNKL